MQRARAAVPALAAALAASCGGPAPPPAAARETPPPAPPAAGEIVPVSGLALTLVPNLPGVDGDDLPELASREVEILEAEKGRLRLKWTGQVRVEKPESARRREDWVRARANAPRGATPEPTVPAVYETREISGTLFFPDFATATAFVLPGLWPEGTATIPGATTLWISPNALAELKGGGRALVPLAASAGALREPAATFLRNAIDRAGRSPAGRPGVWTAGAPTRFGLAVDGADASVAALGARDWLATYTILDGGGRPLVLSVLPQAATSAPADPLASTAALRSLLGYRVAEILRPKAAP